MAAWICLASVSCQGSVTGLDGESDGVTDTPGDRVQDTDGDGEPDVVPPGCGNGAIDPGEDCDPSVSEARDCTAACGSTGSQACTAACTWAACEPPGEICNGLDDDCDGTADNGFECVSGEREDCFEYCDAPIFRTCNAACIWGGCVIPPDLGCNEIILPYGEEPFPSPMTMAFTTGVRYADVYFLVDTSGSMDVEVQELQTAINGSLLTDLRALGPFLRVGMGFFEDYPISPYGGPLDHSYGHLLDMTDDHAQLMDAAGNLPEGYGSDLPESHVAALWSIAVEDGSIQMPALPNAACVLDYFGYPCFRPEGLSLVVLISDAEFHNGPGGEDPYDDRVSCPMFEEAAWALLEAGIRVVSIYSQFSGSTDSDYRALALATQSFNQLDGEPLVFVIPDNSPLLGQTVVNGVRAAVTSIPMNVSARLRDDPSDTVDTAVFVRRIEADVENLVEDTRHGTFCVDWPSLLDEDGDGTNDTFGSLPQGSTVCFRIVPEPNVTYESRGTPLECMASIDILGDGRTLLDTREIVFIVP